MESKIQSLKSILSGKTYALLFLGLFFFCPVLQVCGQAVNELARIEDGKLPEKWLISNCFPAEIDAGAWENFSRFNIEYLPARDWLSPFGGVLQIKPQPGIFKARQQSSTTDNAKSRVQIPKPDELLPEVGAKSTVKMHADATELSWTEFTERDTILDFYSFHERKPVGTAYAASYIKATNDEMIFLETDGFWGKIWLNGKEIYDGFSLNVRKVVPAKFVQGVNLLIVRATGVAGDYWRKNGGWTAEIKFRKTQKVGEIYFGAFRPSGFFSKNFLGGVSQNFLVTLYNPSSSRQDKITIEFFTNDRKTGVGLGSWFSVKGYSIADAELPVSSITGINNEAFIKVALSDKREAKLPVIWGPTPYRLSYGTIYYLEGFHVDPVYLHDQRGYARITLSNTAQYLRNLRADKQYGVYLSEIDYLKPYLDTHPEDREFLREAVKMGRVGTGGAYNQFNENTIGGEAIIRNILYGQSMHQAMLGRKSESLALWDVFGHAPQISQIAAKSGFSGIVWSKKIQGFEPFFYDYALDGSRLLHRRVDYAYSFSGFGSGKNYSFDNFRRLTNRKFAEAQSFNSATDLRINAADFTPPWTNLAGNSGVLEAQKPQIRVTGQAQDLYFRELNKEIEAGKVRPPVSSRDKLFFHVGVSMARSDLKIGQRAAENMTLTAEKFGSVAYFLGAKYPDLALDKAWRQILFGSHHDAITGTPSDNALIDLVHGYREAFELSKGALEDSLAFITKQINTKPKSEINNSKSGLPLIVFNPLNWKRTDTARAKIKFDSKVNNFQIRDDDGQTTQPKILKINGNEADFEFVARDVPSVGYKTFYVEKLENRRVSVDRSYPLELENEFYRIEFDANRGGAIKSIFDKKAKREVIDVSKNRLANEIAVLQEELNRKNVIYPAWELWTTGQKAFSGETKATLVFEQNGESQSYKISGVLPNKTAFVQTITLHKNIRRIDFRTELINYKGKDELFVVTFPLKLEGGALVTEDRFGTVVRNSSRGFLDFRTNTDKLVSGAPVYSVNHWAEYGSTFNLDFLNEKNETISSVPLKPAALVRPHGENFENFTQTVVASLIKRGVSVTPFYDDNDAERRKNLSIEDSTMPKDLNDDAAYHNFRIAVGREKENLYSAKLLQQISKETRADFDQRLDRDGFAFLFLYDRQVPKDHPPIPALLIAANSDQNYKKAIEAIVSPIEKGKFEVNFPIEVFAIESNPEKDLPRVPDYGVALINRGTAGVSMEKGNVLTLFLTHTAVFPGVNLPFEFVPEHKSHIFDYTLYPHEKDWREAETVKVGFEVNNPLIAVQTDFHEGELPHENSFLELDSKQNNLILSALKIGDNRQANFQTNFKDLPRPAVMRFYESEGTKTGGLLTPKFIKREPWLDVLDVFEKTDLLEETIEDSDKKLRNWGTSLPFAVGFEPNSIETFKLTTTGVIERKDEARPEIGVVKEAVQPVFSRYWLHNAGVAPIGNDAVKVTLRAVEQMNELSTFRYDDKYNQGGTTTVAVRVQIVNNYRDRKISGEVALEVPEDWRVVPETLKYEIEPLGNFVEQVALIAFPVKKDLEFERASGLVKARIEHDGQIFQDVLNLGKTFMLEWQTGKTADQVVVQIKNPHRQTIEGAVALITPPEDWYFNAATFPREQGFSVPPRSEIVLKFPKAANDKDSWAIARIAYNGHVEYKRADGK